jgi:hypothetical protein
MTASSENGGSPNDPLWVWYLCKEYTIVEAALLISGHDPAAFEDVEHLTWEGRPKDYETVKNALVRHMEISSGFGNQVQLDRGSEGRIDVRQSTVSFDQLRNWLVERGVSAGFFFGKERAPSSEMTSYLNRDHPRYAPKLAAAVKAWEAVEDDVVAKGGRSPRTLLCEWLEQHATEFDLILGNGKLNRTGIEEVAKVANWKPEGGAPKTPAKS